MRRSAASTRSRARSRSNRVYRRGSDSIRFFRGDARSPNGRRTSLRPTPVDFFAISASLHAPRLRRRETEYSRMRPKRRLLKAMRPSRDHPETCGRVGVNFVKSEKRAYREPQKRGCLSMARTASCLVPPRVEPAGLFSGFEGLFARLLGRSVSLNSKVRNFRSSKALQRFLRRSVRHKRQHRRQEKPHPRCRRVDGAKGTAELFAPLSSKQRQKRRY